jgi:hypothetical protein
VPALVYVAIERRHKLVIDSDGNPLHLRIASRDMMFLYVRHTAAPSIVRLMDPDRRD